MRGDNSFQRRGKERGGETEDRETCFCISDNQKQMQQWFRSLVFIERKTHLIGSEVPSAVFTDGGEGGCNQQKSSKVASSPLTCTVLTSLPVHCKEYTVRTQGRHTQRGTVRSCCPITTITVVGKLVVFCSYKKN